MKALLVSNATVLAPGLVPGTTKTVMAATVINPREFTPTIDNPFLPMIPGTTYIYEGTTEGSPVRDEVEITSRTMVIDHVTCREVRDRMFVDGVLAEDTLDWFAQDSDGNVWCFGEDSKELDTDGNLISTEGSWKAGANGAEPGIVMEAHPRVGDTYQQEYAPGVAEDLATVVALNKTVNVPFGSFHGCLKTEEFTLLEPGAIEYEFYAPGIGLVQSVAGKGGRERLELVSVVRP